MSDNTKAPQPFNCPECSGTFTRLFDWQRHNLLTHMIRREPPPRQQEVPLPESTYSQRYAS